MSFQYSCFISYRHSAFKKATSYVKAIVDSLKEELDLRLDKDLYIDTDRLVPGTMYKEALASDLYRSVCMIALYTPKYFSTDYTFCAREYHSMLRLERQRLALLPAAERKYGLIIPIALRDQKEMHRQIAAAQGSFLNDPSSAVPERLGCNFEPYTGPRGLKVGGALEHELRTIAKYIRDRCLAFDALPRAHAQSLFEEADTFRLTPAEELAPWLTQVRLTLTAPAGLPSRTEAA